MPQTRMNLRADVYRPGDEADILALNRLEYGLPDVMTNPEDFRWRYAENPAGQTQISVVRDEQTRRVVGFAWMIPLQMRIFGQNYLAVLTANQLVHPDYRDGLAYAKLIRHRQRMFRQLGVPFRYSFPIETLFERTGSLERMSSFTIPLLVRPLNMVKLAQPLLTWRGLQMLVGWGGQVIIPLLFRSQAKGTQQHRLEIEWLDQFDERFDGFWARVQDKYAIMAVRNRVYLAWRFAPVSERTYRILVASAGDELAGYVVLRCTDEIRGIPTGLIMDLLLEPGSRGEKAGLLLMAEAWQYFRAKGVGLVGGLALPHTVEYQVMRHAGYRPCPQRLVPRVFRVAFNCYDPALPDTARVQANDWFVTIADYEAH
jgi:GNAT superfamily N-acetyltransferase/predicted N-acetyltransferase YhbS